MINKVKWEKCLLFLNPLGEPAENTDYKHREKLSHFEREININKSHK